MRLIGSPFLASGRRRTGDLHGFGVGDIQAQSGEAISPDATRIKARDIGISEKAKR